MCRLFLASLFISTFCSTQSARSSGECIHTLYDLPRFSARPPLPPPLNPFSPFSFLCILLNSPYVYDPQCFHSLKSSGPCAWHTFILRVSLPLPRALLGPSTCGRALALCPLPVTMPFTGTGGLTNERYSLLSQSETVLNKTAGKEEQSKLQQQKKTSKSAGQTPQESKMHVRDRMRDRRA